MKSVAGLTQAQLQAHERAKAMFNISAPLAARSGFHETVLYCSPWADHVTWSAWRLGRWQHLSAPPTAMLAPWSDASKMSSSASQQQPSHQGHYLPH